MTMFLIPVVETRRLMVWVKADTLDHALGRMENNYRGDAIYSDEPDSVEIIGAGAFYETEDGSCIKVNNVIPFPVKDEVFIDGEPPERAA